MKSILIIDDDVRNTFALSAVLKAKDYSVFTAHNITDAFAILELNEQIGIILLDMMMPGMDGYDAIPLLRSVERYKDIPIVAVTAQAMPGDREKCLEAGADNYIAKPVDAELLFEILNKQLK
ncbi:MAG TPA: response regulator [Parafilimonas sp.]